jgi:hypothetical protein
LLVTADLLAREAAPVRATIAVLTEPFAFQGEPMRRLALIPVALAFCCIAFAQGDGAYQQWEREQPTVPCQARRGAGPDQSLAVGTTLPKAYRGNQVVVTDWNAHKLSKPTWGRPMDPGGRRLRAGGAPHPPHPRDQVLRLLIRSPITACGGPLPAREGLA